MPTIEKFNALIENLEENVNEYVSKSNVPPQLADNVSSIRTWVDEQNAAADRASTTQNIENAGKVIQASIASIDDLSHGRYVQGGLRIAGSVAALIGGPYGALAGAMCGILGSVLSAGSPKQPDLATRLSSIVCDELKKFNQAQKAECFAGLQARVRNINIALKNMKQEATACKSLWWMRGQSKNPFKTLKIPDEDLFQSDFPQFIGEVGSTFEGGLAPGSSEAEIKECIASIVSYCNAQASYIILLTNVLATFEMTGHQTKFIVELLDAQKSDARTRLGTVADGAIPSQQAKINMIFHLRKNTPSYEVVECFRHGLEMTPIPSLDETANQARNVARLMPEPISDGYPQPHKKGDHYFQLINHTDCPFKVFCGTAGDHINGLEFRTDVMPYSSYEHAATKLLQTFSAGGCFFLYLDKVLRSFDKPREGKNWRVFEFALSNPFIGCSKIKIMDKSTDAAITSGHDCWQQMEDSFTRPIFFSHGDKEHYAVYADIMQYDPLEQIMEASPLPSVLKIGAEGPKFYTWRFVVQKYDPKLVKPKLVEMHE